MEAWGVWKPGLNNPPTHGVVLAVLTSTAPPPAVGGSIVVNSRNPAEIGLSLLVSAVLTGKVSPDGAERCPGPVTGGPASCWPWPIGH